MYYGPSYAIPQLKTNSRIALTGGQEDQKVDPCGRGWNICISINVLMEGQEARNKKVTSSMEHE